VSPFRHGFTLMEMVITIVILGIISTSFGIFIVPAINSYNAQTQRAALVDVAEEALRRMTRDIRIAVPNSVRVTSPTGTGGFAIELVPTVDGGRYCPSVAGGVTAVADCGSVAGGLVPTTRQVLDFTAADTEFDIVGCFQSTTFTGYRLVIGNTGNEIYTAAGTSAVITPTTTTISISTDPAATTCGTTPSRHHVTLSAAQLFPALSPRQRLFVVDNNAAPVSYICDPTVGVQTLRRYWSYAFTAAQPTSAPGGSPQSALMASGVTACSISSQTGDVQNTGVVTLTVKLADGAGETVTLMHQALLDNSQ